MKLLRLLVVSCVLAGSFVSSPALARQCIWNGAGFNLEVKWMLSGRVVDTTWFPLGQGRCSPTDDREYTVLLSALNAEVADKFMKGMIMLAGVGLGMVTGGAGMAAMLAVAAGTSAANFAASEGMKIPNGAFYVGIPSQDNYLDVWGTVWNPQTGDGGRITQPHAPQTPSSLSTTLIGVGQDNYLYTRPTLNSKWSYRIENSCCVTGVAANGRGQVIGVGMDEYMWVRDKLDLDWKRIENSCCVRGIAVMPDDSIVGYNGDSVYWWTWSQAGWYWERSGPAYLKSLSVTANGLLLGVGSDNKLWTRLQNGTWQEVPNNTANTSLGPIMGAAALADGTIVVLGLEKHIWVQKTLASRVQSLTNGWTGNGGDLNMISIAAGRVSIW